MKRALVVGASRNLGLGLVAELARRGWEVTGTVRGPARTPLHDLADGSDGRVLVEHADVTGPDDLRALRERVPGGLDLLFVNAGVTDEDVSAEVVGTDVFASVMVTNALGPVRALDALSPLVASGGTTGIMSSRQGSVSLNTRGGHEVYRASKAALNQLVRSYAARQEDDRALLLLHPGWVQTELGGAGAPLTVEESARGVVDVLEGHAGEPGLQFLDHRGEVVPW